MNARNKLQIAIINNVIKVKFNPSQHGRAHIGNLVYEIHFLFFKVINSQFSKNKK